MMASRSPRALALAALLAASPAACTSLTQPPSPEAVATESPNTVPAASGARPIPQPSAAPAAAAPGGDKVNISVLAQGKGDGAKDGDVLSVNYTGTLVDGTKFDSSRDPGRDPFKLTLGRGGVIKGWEQGLQGMKVGEKRKLVIPPSLGYGARGSPPKIPPNATLVFEVELMAINPK